MTSFAALHGHPPVCRSADELRAELAGYPDTYYCVYLGHRRDWGDSTSYRYMNEALAGFRYVPIDIEADGDIDAVLEVVETAPNVLGLNITSPFKNHPTVRERCAKPVVDSVNFVVRRNGGLVGYELNGLAFLSWLEATEGLVAGKSAVICGAGGSGLAIATRLSERGVAAVTLVDPVDRSEAAAEIRRATWVASLGVASTSVASNQGLIFILALPRGAEDPNELRKFLITHARDSAVFVDIRVDSDVTPELARKQGWRRAHNGNGMNEHNDLAMFKLLLEEQARRLPESPLQIDEGAFLGLVQQVEAQVQAGAVERSRSAQKFT